MDKLDALVDAIEKRFVERADADKKNKEVVDKEAVIKTLEEKVAALEASPVLKKDFNTIEVGTPDMYKGFNFKRQFASHKFLAPENEATKDKAVKEMLDIVDIFKNKGFVNKAAMQIGTATEGGNLVPETWANEVQMKAALYSVAMQDCQTFNFPDGASELNIPKQANGFTITWANEEAASSESEPTVGTVQLQANRGGFWGVMSQELLDDAGYDVVGFLTKLAVQAMAQEIDNQVFNGTTFTGLLPSISTNAKRWGMTTSAAGAGTDAGDMTALDWANAISLISASRRIGAKWYLAKEVLPYIRTLTTGSAGVPLMDMVSGTPSPTIFGYPVVEVDAISGTDSAVAQKMVAYGNLNNYALGYKLLPNSITMNPWAGTEFKQNQVLFRMYMRADGAPLFEENFASLGSAADA